MSTLLYAQYVEPCLLFCFFVLEVGVSRLARFFYFYSHPIYRCDTLVAARRKEHRGVGGIFFDDLEHLGGDGEDGKVGSKGGGGGFIFFVFATRPR